MAAPDQAAPAGQAVLGAGEAEMEAETSAPAPEVEDEQVDHLTAGGGFRRIPLTQDLQSLVEIQAGTEAAAPEGSPGLLENAGSRPGLAERVPSLPENVSYILPPPLPREGEAVYMLTIILRATGDKTRDVLRMRRIYGIASTYPGNDRLAFHVFERGRGYLVEFPNFTTGWCPELISRLNFLVGSENVRVEPITFQ
jgi:hypothetical protein